jgi:hypothetical protein
MKMILNGGCSFEKVSIPPGPRMKVLMLDTKHEVELDEIEAVSRILAGIAVEAPMQSSVASTQYPAPETAALDRTGQTAMKPRPQPRPAPQGSPRQEKRGRK